jgi:hypothetical protein
MLVWGPPCMKVINGCDLRRFGSIKIVSTGYRSGITSTDALSSRRALSTRISISETTNSLIGLGAAHHGD